MNPRNRICWTGMKIDFESPMKYPHDTSTRAAIYMPALDSSKSYQDAGM